MNHHKALQSLKRIATKELIPSGRGVTIFNAVELGVNTAHLALQVADRVHIRVLQLKAKRAEAKKAKEEESKKEDKES